jgi:hypothetical protein
LANRRDLDPLDFIGLCRRPLKSRFIALQYHFIRQYVQEGVIKPHYVSTHDNIADIFTKNLPKDKFLELRWAMGLTQ